MKQKYLARIANAYVFQRKHSNLSFWHTPLSVNNLEEVDLRTVRKYPMNFQVKTLYNKYHDQDGIIMLNYYGDLGLQYNPNAIAQQALGYYDKFIENNNLDDKKNFLTQANYFLKHGRLVKDDVLLWEYNFPFEMRNDLLSPWRSALAQGQALSVLIKAHILTGDDRYAKAAHSGVRAFNYLAQEHEGGVLDDHGGNIWLEEYIVDPPNHVLNGFVWALWGVRDYAVYFDDAYTKKLYDDCLKTLENNIQNYDLGFWTTYDWPQGLDKKLPIMPSSLYYQRLHAVQMLALYNLTRREIFNEYYLKWDEYYRSFWRRYVSQIWKVYFKLRYF